MAAFIDQHLCAIVLGLAVLGGGCADPSASLSLSLDGPEKLPDLLSELSIDWDGEATWTREITCTLSWDGDGSTYTVAAFDRSVAAGLDLALVIQRFDGPGLYERDLYQPEPAFTLSLQDGDDAWRFGSDSDGTCSFEVDQRSRSGSFACQDIPIIENMEVTSSTVAVSGLWRCGVLTRAGFY